MKRSEQETTITWTAADSHVRIYTCHRPTLNRLLARDGVGVERQGEYADGSPYASLLVPLERFDIVQAVRRQLNETERARYAQNLPNSREVL